MANNSSRLKWIGNQVRRVRKVVGESIGRGSPDVLEVAIYIHMGR